MWEGGERGKQWDLELWMKWVEWSRKVGGDRAGSRGYLESIDGNAGANISAKYKVRSQCVCERFVANCMAWNVTRRFFKLGPTLHGMECEKALLQAGANVNAKNKVIRHCVYVTQCKLHSMECVKALLQVGATKSAKNKVGKTAMDMARNKKVKELIKAHMR
eukprot:gene27963-8846_t